MLVFKRVFEEYERPIFNTATKKPSWVFVLLVIFTTAAILTLQVTRNPIVPPKRAWDREVLSGPDGPSSCSGFFSSAAQPRIAVVKSILEFGGVGDGRTSNTAAFRGAVEYMERRKGQDAAQLNVPNGRWVTGSFNLTSNFTLFLEDGAVILGAQDPEEWPIIEPLPSYGRGRERPGGRHISLIHGNSLSNVVITGSNGSIDGQGKMWWDMWWNKTLDHTRGHLLELINSTNVLISNLTFLNSPFWTIHPVYCRVAVLTSPGQYIDHVEYFDGAKMNKNVNNNSMPDLSSFGVLFYSNVVIRNMTILAPLNAPNTDGIDPDSSTNVCIEDCYIESGDDLVAIKSGWDQYGISMAKPSVNITIRRVSGMTPTCSGIGIGSEMSGGIRNVLVEDVCVRDSAAGVRIKTDKGRGGYIRNITIRNIKMERVKVPIRFSRGANDHPGEKWDREALPEVRGITISDVVSLDSRKAPQLLGIKGTMFTDICLKNVSILGLFPSMKWSCEFVSGFSEGVTPMPCLELRKNGSASWCS